MYFNHYFRLNISDFSNKPAIELTSVATTTGVLTNRDETQAPRTTPRNVTQSVPQNTVPDDCGCKASLFCCPRFTRSSRNNAQPSGNPPNNKDHPPSYDTLFVNSDCWFLWKLSKWSPVVFVPLILARHCGSTLEPKISDLSIQFYKSQQLNLPG